MKDPKASIDLVSSNARAVLRAVEGGGGRKHMCRKSELNTEYWAEIQARSAQGNVRSFGYPELDTYLVEGSAPQKTCVVTGLSGSGKSTFCADWTIRLAKMGRRPLYCALEMGPASTIDIMVSNLTGIPIRQIVQGHIPLEDMPRVRKAVAWITRNIAFMKNGFFSEELRKGKRTNDRNLDMFEGSIAESGCDVIIVDLWERILADLSYDGMTQALYRQQNMFEEYNVFGVIVQQLRLKDVEKRSDKRPTREGIKGTGAFVEVADQIFGVHREAQFKNVPDNTIELICLKQRKGEANWSIQYDWDGAKSSISGIGREVSFDPGLDDVVGIGGIEDIQTAKTKRKGGRSRREENV
jgi:replicative DNA helicase